MPRAFGLSPPPSFKFHELFGELLDAGTWVEGEA